MIWWLALGLLAAIFIAGAITCYFWNEIRETIQTWLRKNQLDKSILVDVLVFLDRYATVVRRYIVVRTTIHAKPVLVEEKTMSIHEIDDPEVKRRLEQNHRVLLTMQMLE